MASKKIKRVKNPITKAPSGVSFTYAPDERERELPHAWAEKPEHRCEHDGRVYVIGPNKHVGVNRPDALIYGCDACDWKSPSGNFKHEPTPKTEHHVETRVIKKHKSHRDPVELRDAIRAEFHRRRDVCMAERKKFPPSLLKKGRYAKGPKKGEIRWVSNPAFTDAMRAHMSKFQFSPESIRDELLKEGV